MDTALFFAEMTLLGVGVGLLSGALGLGGGILMVPAFLTFVPGMDAHTATGTSLFIIIFVAAQNAWRILRRLPDPPWRLGLWLGLGTVAGSAAASHAITRLPEPAVLLFFIALTAFLAVRTLLVTEREVRPGDVRRRRPTSIAIGFLAGLSGGATGTGGGSVLIPLALMAGIASNRDVVGLSNIVLVLTGVAGVAVRLHVPALHGGGWTVGHVAFALAPAVFLGALVGSPAGRALNRRLTLAQRRAAMAALLLLICLQMVYKLFA